MALSDYEKQVLAELEAEFEKDTTRQGASTQRAAHEFSSTAEKPRSRGHLSVRRIAVGGVIAVVGLVLLLLSVSLGYSPLSIGLGAASFLLVVGGVYYALHTTPTHRSSVSERSHEQTGKGFSSTSAVGGRLRRFMDEQERRWDERER